jgi:hypothetical protein
METCLAISGPVITRANMGRISAKRWASILGRLKGQEREVLMRLGRSEWVVVRDVKDLQAFVRLGGQVW